MNNESNLKGLDTHCENVQELMESIPSWIQRWGITLIAIIIISAIFICNNIQLPQKIKIELFPLRSSEFSIVYTPSIGKIYNVNLVDRNYISSNDTLFIFEDYTGNITPVLAPISGYIKVSGPLSSGKTLPEAIELLQIHSTESHLSYYYGNINSDYIKDLSVGDTLSLNNHVAKISFISPYPSSTGDYYIEVISPYTGINTNQISYITISSESILHKLLSKVSVNL